MKKSDSTGDHHASNTKISLQTILNQFREDARNNRDLGDRFERLMLRFFEIDPLYLEKFDKIWMWNDWPDKGAVGDIGIDLVARDGATHELVAIQCKFYLPEHTLSKKDIDSFFTAMGREQFTSGLIVSTTDKWGKNADDALNHQTKPVNRLSIHDLQESPVDWSKFDARRPQDLDTKPKHKPKPHQREAIDDVIQGFKEADRGKLIMACGTGKTFTALKIAEEQAPGGNILFLVPSLSLLAQTLREWTAQATEGIHAMAVCSDSKIGKRRSKAKDDEESITVQDLAFPATTNDKELSAQYKYIAKKADAKDDTQKLTVVFSTYHSIEAVSKAQKAGLPEFDLVICDEAHRTTGVTLVGEDESHFVKIHEAKFIKAKKRLYMTATPRIYGDDAKSKAIDAAAEVASMDDPNFFGEEFHRLGFGEAVKNGLLTDYKVLVLAVDESYVAKTFQKQLASKSELNLDDATRITGCWNGLEKRFESIKDAPDLQGDVQPMRRAVAFSRTIKDSKKFVQQFHDIVAAYKDDHPDLDNLLDIQADHVDGSDDALRRNSLLDWLKQDAPGNTARILSNARCLSEGVDVPALDAVMFLNPRNSVVDVVQSVGRVMRRSEDTNKRFGYIILPIGIPADKTPEEALKDNEKYKVVWQVLQALRAHDDRFNATINQIELNKNRPDNIQVIGVGGDGEDEGSASDGDSKPKVREVQGAFAFPQLEEWKDAIYAKMVKKCGDRAYWATWAGDIARIAEKHITRIKALVKDKDAPYSKDFAEFLAGLQQNLNPAVSEDESIEMLAQHLITRPVFDALFADYDFTAHNPVSMAMQTMVDKLDEQSVSKEAETLNKFYDSVRDRAANLDNAKARQDVIIELYDEFFKNAFPRMAQRLGIVYTPVEVVDFIIHSVQDILHDQFNSSLGDKDVHIIDPFTGTGTFIVRLLQSGLIDKKDLARKFKNELHANEIVLLAYYIAAINIEETYHGIMSTDEKPADYEPFDGIVLTDTFQMYESQHGKETKFAGHFPENSKRAKRQQLSPIRVVIANPPYSAKQGSANDDNQNLEYQALDARIRSTYASSSVAGLKSYLYDSYIRAMRWASDRIDDRGVIGFVTNGTFIDGNAMDGLRSCLADEFTSVYIFNLRGNARTSGEDRRKEKGNVFGGGTRTPVAITILVKNPDHKGKSKIHYHDIGDYLTRDDKLKVISRFASIDGLAKAKQWKQIKPNPEHDWVNQRDPAYDSFLPLVDKSKPEESLFYMSTLGVSTNRDAWAYSFSKKKLRTNVSEMVAFYNQQLDNYSSMQDDSYEGRPEFSEVINTDSSKISWSAKLKSSFRKGINIPYSPANVRVGTYRPFTRQHLYLDTYIIERPGKSKIVQPKDILENAVISVTGKGSTGEFSTYMSNVIVDLNFMSGGSQCLPLYLYERIEEEGKLGFDTSGGDGEVIDGYRRRDAITDGILKTFQNAYEKKVSKEDIFYYVYGILHSPEYRERFSSDLKKMLPRIPLTKETKDFWAFTQAGRNLAQWHLNYETIEPWPLVEHDSGPMAMPPLEKFKVKKMAFARPSKAQKEAGKKHDKTQIKYNDHITLSGIPIEAYDYVVNGKPAIEWLMDRYKVTVDKSSGIRNDPNDWSKEHDDPRYILDLIGRVTRVSIETMKLVESLPALNERIAE